ncbi:hypothetical protein K7432_005852 [Basidiobolus ranarum]|uniref:Uncharacterized protein n=1 Tax=Basidiobolus ranarum TaxID=34480 RepID=A0ABR2W2I0_9FUNG
MSIDFGSLTLPARHKSKSNSKSLIRWSSDGGSNSTKNLYPRSTSSFYIQGDPLRHEMVVQARGQHVYYLRTEWKLFGRKLALYDDSNDVPIYQVKSHKALGYMEIGSSVPTTRFRFPYPRLGHGMYSFEVEGTRFVWDYRQDTYLKCYDTTDMSVVAEVFWKDTPSNRSSYSSFSSKSVKDIHYAKYVSKMVITRYNEYGSTKQILIVLTGLLVLRNAIWKKLA